MYSLIIQLHQLYNSTRTKWQQLVSESPTRSWMNQIGKSRRQRASHGICAAPTSDSELLWRLWFVNFSYSQAPDVHELLSHLTLMFVVYTFLSNIFF
ncbi:unnamed protein product [Citrullus colocynthis]|uniref:Uncharacterized protein n=1 Tax=Citrullus colocynthis TaxID=252529 RepID=A0ABP0Y899_9ROSI